LFVDSGHRVTERSWTLIVSPGARKPARRLPVGLAILLALVSFPAHAAAATDEVVAVCRFDPAQLEFDQYEGYDVVSLEGAEFSIEPGEPMVPSVSVQLLLPTGATCENVSVTCRGTSVVPGVFNILPAPRPARLSPPEAANVPQPNTETYNSRLPYPREAARLAGVGSLAGYRIATVRVAPLSYVPATGELSLHREIEIRLATTPAADGSRVGGGAAARQLVERAVANPRRLADYAPSLLRSEAVDELIVCPEMLRDAFEPLAAWKTRKGVRTLILSLEEIEADPLYDGVDTAARIRNAITHYFVTAGLSYVLLGGDTDLVPTRMAYDFFYDQGIPCDLYYSDLDGDWNADGDGRWAEADEDAVDMVSDVFVGRAPVRTASEAETFVAKVLAYEGAAFALDDGFELTMVYLGEVLWDSPDPFTDGAVACDMIDDESVPPRFDPATKLYESEGGLTQSTAWAALEAGAGIVMHEGHSNITKAGIGPDNLTNGELDALTNGDRGGVWYSIGCWSAAIDYDTFGEHWVRNPLGGGVAYVGNSRYGWGCPGYPGQCVSDLYGRQYFDSLFVRDLVHAGVVHADAKDEYVGLARVDDYMRYAMYELNLLGDPEMPVWTDRPLPLDVTHDQSVALVDGAAEVGVLVTRDGSPVVGAVVCLSAPDAGAYDVAETDAAGRATLAASADAACDGEIVVTAENAIPNGSTVAIGGETGVVESGGQIPDVTALMNNYPNPFNPSTTVAFATARRGRVTVAVYDVTGRRVRVLSDTEMDAGLHAVRWDGRDESGRDCASGTYFARMTTSGSHFETKMILMR
jgi:hypothetical protein